MKIGIFTDAYHPQVNGVVTSTVILKNELEKMGHEVYIITVSDPRADENEKNVFRLSSIPLIKLKDFRLGSLFSISIIRELKKLELDIIHTQTEFSIGIFARIVAKAFDIPIVHTYHTLYEDYTHYFSPKLMEKYAKKLAQKASKMMCDTVDGVVVPSGKTKLLLKNYGTNNSIYVVPTGIDLTMFDNSNIDPDKITALKNQYGIINKEHILIYIGRIAREKNITALISAMGKIVQKKPDAVLVIVGDGPEKDSLEKISLKAGLEKNIIFTGKVPWSEIPYYYKMSKIFLCASRTETQGLTYIEALASGIPIAAAYDINLEGILKDDYSCCFFYSDEEIPDKVLTLLDDNSKMADMVKTGYQVIKPFRSSNFAENVIHVYEKVLNDVCSSKKVI